IDDIDKAMEAVNETRSSIGAKTNALESGIKYNYNTAENTTAAQSRVKDTDMASELIKKRRAEMSHQAGLAMMRQNNAARAAQNSIFNSQV
ncbi:MAG: hypothetical protein II156_01475, partial [Lachnospiraceae bacterium]|nr:hypothetical protein [Lachnospiraceae bacterium]